MRKYLIIGLVALCAVAMAVPAFALDVRFSGNFFVRSYVQAEFDGKNEWTGTQLTNAAASGNYANTHIYDRGSHFLMSGPGAEDNPAAVGYATFLTGPGPSAGATADMAIGPALGAAGGGQGIAMRGTQGNVDDEIHITDYRWRLWMTFQIADCIKQVTAFETGDSAWGLAGDGSDWGADDVDVEVKQAYIDFSIPALPFPTNFKVGVIPIKLHRGWLLNVDCGGLIATATFEPVTVGFIYTKAFEGGAFQNRQDDANAFGGTVIFNMDQFRAQATLLYQDGPSSTFTSNIPGNQGAVDEFSNTIHWYGLDLDYTTEAFKVYFTGLMNGGSNDYYRLNDRTSAGVGVAVGATNLSPVEADYNGFMFDVGVDVFMGPFTMMLQGFYITGDEFKDHSAASKNVGVQNFFLMEDSDDEIDRFVYPGPNPWNANGCYYAWSEILGAGTFNANSLGRPAGASVFGGWAPGNGSFGQWQGSVQPYNVWAIKLGGKYKVTDSTAISAFYWYASTTEDVVSTIDESSANAFGNAAAYGNVKATDSSIGSEIDLYIDQTLCDGLVLRLVGAYLFADDAYSIWSDDEDAYEYGARLLVSF